MPQVKSQKFVYFSKKAHCKWAISDVCIVNCTLLRYAQLGIESVGVDLDLDLVRACLIPTET